MTALVEQALIKSVADSAGERYCDVLQGELASGTFASKGDRTSFKLKVAAARVLEETGYTDLKVADICARADVALGTFYVYFQDKNEIAIRVVLEFVEHLYAKVEQVGRHQHAFDAILNTNRFFILAYQANPGLLRCLVQLQSQLAEFRALWRPRHLQWIESLARSIAKRGSFSGEMAGLSMHVAHALEGMVFNYLYSNLVSEEPVLGGHAADVDTLAMMLSTLWYRAVYCKDPPVAPEGASA
jgi:AcrR family transcriptional regulator